MLRLQLWISNVATSSPKNSMQSTLKDYMPIKKIHNEINVFEHEDVVSFFTNSKKNHFQSESKLFDDLQSWMLVVSSDYRVHLTTHPYIAVHVVFGLVGGLQKNKSKIKSTIVEVLTRHLRQT